MSIETCVLHYAYLALCSHPWHIPDEMHFPWNSRIRPANERSLIYLISDNFAGALQYLKPIIGYKFVDNFSMSPKDNIMVRSKKCSQLFFLKVGTPTQHILNYAPDLNLVTLLDIPVVNS